MANHICKDGKESAAHTWWEHDNKGLPLCKVCSDCRESKLAKYDPSVLLEDDQPEWFKKWKASDDYDYSDVYGF